jgi:hypothetical protein
MPLLNAKPSRLCRANMLIWERLQAYAGNLFPKLVGEKCQKFGQHVRSRFRNSHDAIAGISSSSPLFEWVYKTPWAGKTNLHSYSRAPITLSLLHRLV